MKVHYEDIKAKEWSEQKAVLYTLRAISLRSNESLEIECQSPQGSKGWMPSMVSLETADKFVLDGKVIKDRFERVK